MRNLFNPESFWMVFLSRLFDFFVLNIVAVVCALPVVTVGASVTGLYAAMAAFAGGREVRLRVFFSAFRRQFARATLVWLVLLGMGYAVYLDLQIVAGVSAGGLRVAVLAGVFFLALCLLLTAAALFPMLAVEDGASLRVLCRRAFVTAVARLPQTVFLTALWLLPLGVWAVSPTWFLVLGFLWAFLWFVLTAWLGVKLTGVVPRK